MGSAPPRLDETMSDELLADGEFLLGSTYQLICLKNAIAWLSQTVLVATLVGIITRSNMQDQREARAS
jgi:hypothetical protein